MKISKGSISDGRNYISTYVSNKKKENSSFRVIDIGGAVNGWTQPFVDFLVDINAPETEKNLKIDICIESEWDKLKKIVSDQGKFDYCICTHTLEDLYNPLTPLMKIPEIANSGIITMPDAKTELSHVESSKWLGYIHHRWIFDVEDNKMLIVPKLNFIDSLVQHPSVSTPAEIRYEWSDTIEYKMFMNNYLGPTVKTVIAHYTDFIKNL